MLGRNGPQRRQSPDDGARGDICMYKHTDRRTDSPCVLQDFVPFKAAAQKHVIIVVIDFRVVVVLLLLLLLLLFLLLPLSFLLLLSLCH